METYMNMSDEIGPCRAYYDRHTGDAIVVDLGSDKLKFCEEHPDRFVKFFDESLFDDDWYLMEEFIDGLDEHQDELYAAIRGRGAFRRFRMTVEELGLRGYWEGFKEVAHMKTAKEWCRENGVIIDD
jgi:hypothetical protein